MARFGGGAVLIAFFVIRNLAVECQDRKIIIHVPHRVQMVHHHHHHVVLMDPKTRTMTSAGPLPQPEIPRSLSEEDSYAQLIGRHGRQQRAQLLTDTVVYPVARLPVVDASHAFAGWPVRNKRSKLVNRRSYMLVKSSDF